MAADGLHKTSVYTESLFTGSDGFLSDIMLERKRLFSACSYVLPLFTFASTDLVNMHLAMVKIFSIGDFTLIHLEQGFSQV